MDTLLPELLFCIFDVSTLSSLLVMQFVSTGFYKFLKDYISRALKSNRFIRKNEWCKIGLIIHKHEHGKYISYGMDDETTKSILTAKNGYSTLLKRFPEKPTKLIFDIEDTAFIIDESKVNDIYPQVAFRILHSLGFKQYKNNKLNKIISLKTWINLLSENNKKKLMDKTIFFLKYIKLLVDFINSNPYLLNKKQD